MIYWLRLPKLAFLPAMTTCKAVLRLLKSALAAFIYTFIATVSSPLKFAFIALLFIKTLLAFLRLLKSTLGAVIYTTPATVSRLLKSASVALSYIKTFPAVLRLLKLALGAYIYICPLPFQARLN